MGSLERLRAKLQNLTEQYEDLQRDKQNLEFKLNHSRNDFATAQAKKDREQEQLTKLIQLKSKLRQEISDNEAKLKKIEEVFLQLKELNNERELQNDALTDQMKTLESHLKVLEA